MDKAIPVFGGDLIRGHKSSDWILELFHFHND
jgi:hypothetical protein